MLDCRAAHLLAHARVAPARSRRQLVRGRVRFQHSFAAAAAAAAAGGRMPIAIWDPRRTCQQRGLLFEHLVMVGKKVGRCVALLLVAVCRPESLQVRPDARQDCRICIWHNVAVVAAQLEFADWMRSCFVQTCWSSGNVRCFWRCLQQMRCHNDELQLGLLSCASALKSKEQADVAALKGLWG